MYLKEDAGMMERIFCLSDFALTRMINRMFGKNTSLRQRWCGTGTAKNLSASV